jgi:hypothetical protein
MNFPETSPARLGKSARRHQKKHSLRVDMTPMVDLAFLLIAFFIFTAEISRPKAMFLVMPKDGDSSRIGESMALSILPGGGNRVFYYHGDQETALSRNEIFETDFSFSGIGRIIREKKKRIEAGVTNPDGNSGMMLLIKPGTHADYKNVVDILDEALINNVKKYAILKPSPEEKDFLDKKARSGSHN